MSRPRFGWYSYISWISNSPYVISTEFANTIYIYYSISDIAEVICLIFWISGNINHKEMPFTTLKFWTLVKKRKPFNHHDLTVCKFNWKEKGSITRIRGCDSWSRFVSLYTQFHDDNIKFLDLTSTWHQLFIDMPSNCWYKKLSNRKLNGFSRKDTGISSKVRGTNNLALNRRIFTSAIDIY